MITFGELCSPSVAIQADLGPQRPKRGVLRRVLRKPVTKDEASRQSRSVKKRPAASKPNYVPEHQKLDSETAQLKDVIWMNTEVVLEDLLKMSEKQLLQTLYKSKHLLKPSACPHCGKESLGKLAFLRNKWHKMQEARAASHHQLCFAHTGGVEGASWHFVLRCLGGAGQHGACVDSRGYRQCGQACVEGLEALAGYLVCGRWRSCDEDLLGSLIPGTHRAEDGRATGGCIDFALCTPHVCVFARHQARGVADHDLVSYDLRLDSS